MLTETLCGINWSLVWKIQHRICQLTLGWVYKYKLQDEKLRIWCRRYEVISQELFYFLEWFNTTHPILKWLGHRGVYFVPKLYNCPKVQQARGEHFYTVLIKRV